MRKLFLAAAATIVLAGPSGAADVRGVTDKEIVIGTFTDLSGVTVEWGVNNSNGYRLAFDEQNAGQDDLGNGLLAVGSLRRVAGYHLGSSNRCSRYWPY